MTSDATHSRRTAPTFAALRGQFRRDASTKFGLYEPAFEHDACGVGLLCNVKGLASHQLVEDALKMLENMSHRGACGCEPESGDGAGIMVRTPDAFLRRVCREQDITLPPLEEYAVGMVFLPRTEAAREECEQVLGEIARGYGMRVLGWRDVPTDSSIIGASPRSTEPVIRQVFIGIGKAFYNRTDFSRRLYLVRQRAENQIEFGSLSEEAREWFYICLLSTNRIVYKGMLTPHQLRRYFPDLSAPDFSSSMALVHSRFSTNTFPSWRLAQPFRYLAHNGEINTLRGNRNWMRARYGSLRSEIFGAELDRMRPLLTDSGSDSATLDNALQLLCVSGRSLPHSLRMLIPEAWEKNRELDPELRAFYEYHACLVEPWDGPAALAFCDGKLAGAMLDRNGLRPARYYLTQDDVVILASEVGVLQVAPERVRKKGRVQPGTLFLIDLAAGRIVEDAEIKQQLTDLRPWRRWLERGLVELESLPAAPPPGLEPGTLRLRQRIFGYTAEDIRLVLAPMATHGEENVGSMGNDAPLACLSPRPQLLFSYFRQLFAQVTNPPLDAIREELVTSLDTYLGRCGNLLSETPRHCRLVKLPEPLLSNEDLARLRSLTEGDIRAVTLPMHFSASAKGPGLALALSALCDAAAQAVRDGASILILSDRAADAERAPIPSLLATAAVHQHLITEGTRAECGLVIETGEPREPHHFCLLIGYGASAVNPYLALSSLAELVADRVLDERLDVAQATKNYLKAASKAILKVASKMGISTIQSYRGAQIFEAVGLSSELVERYFTGTPSRLGGIGLEIIATETLMRHEEARASSHAPALAPGGDYQWLRDGTYHAWNPETVARLQRAVRTGSDAAYAEYVEAVTAEAQEGPTLRGVLRFRPTAPVPLAEVEPAREIVKRFVTGAMSFGAISKEAHETLAIAMNRIGSRSNSGEGGEDRARYRPEPDGSSRRSAIKQVASGRFGVTAEYLVNADELQIKLAQGAKPGEGGQLPGHKVDVHIAAVRHTAKGVGLISPPPHHDIYSIEDLAQLIHDLKCINPRARISVKLVSEVGIGAVAAGVAKAKADHIVISGDGGGTGAAPLGSIKHAGLPWELGLAEAQQVLVQNGLRGRVVLQTDGQCKTARDVVIAALLGAEEVGFATAPLIAMGCVMMRVCHLNTCPVGIATQDPLLRQRFAGTPEHVIRFMFFIAEETRRLMAELGFRCFADMVGQVERLEAADLSQHWKARHLDLSALLHKPAPALPLMDGALRCMQTQEHGLDGELDHELLRCAAPALLQGEPVRIILPIRNTDRSVGAMLSGRVAERFGHAGLPDGLLSCHFTGSAGQSFGCFLARGISFYLAGDANDYVGKGLSGGRIALFPPTGSTFRPEDNIIAGNVIGYGATAGELYLAGAVGERFCVRNSGADAVVEGVGDHGCEYMTGGRVVVLGATGRNFAAGMSGGTAYVLDIKGRFRDRCNLEQVSVEPVETDADSDALLELLQRHVRYTGSELARAVLADFPHKLPRFVKVMPHDFRRSAERSSKLEATASG